jgi:hypothetical protein
VSPPFFGIPDVPEIVRNLARFDAEAVTELFRDLRQGPMHAIAPLNSFGARHIYRSMALILSIKLLI